MQSRKGQALSALVFIGSIMAMLYAVFYIQQLSVAIGIYSGIYATSRAYNVTLSATDIGFISNLQSLGLALQLSYLMLALALMMFAFAVLQLFQSRRGASSMALAGASIFYAALAYILETSFNFAEPYIYFAVAIAGAILTAVPALYMAAADKPARGARMSRNISVDPLTPYSNMLKLSGELGAKMHGNLRILDMHFDTNGLRNLAAMLKGNERNYTSVSVLTRRDRLDSTLMKECRDFSDELRNSGVEFSIRAMNGEDAAMQHERLMLDGSHAYKIPPLNIINKKSEHIVSIARNEAAKRFNYVWNRGTKLDNVQQA